MTSKEFAEKNVGRKVLYGVNHTLHARVVGWYQHNSYGIKSSYVIIEPDDIKQGWSRKGSDRDNFWILDDATRGWHITFDNLVLVVSFPTPKPYPNTCKRCKSPARRIIGQSILCSNSKCKSWKLLDKTYRNLEPVIKKAEFDMLPSGLIYYLEAWKNGSCLICGIGRRDGLYYAHHRCWNVVNKEDRDAIIKIVGKAK